MTRNELIARWRDSSAANRLTPGEVAHMIDLALDWGLFELDGDGAENAQVEGADSNGEHIIEPAPVPDVEPEPEVYDDSDEDEDETESVTAPRGRRASKTRAAKPAPRRHR